MATKHFCDFCARELFLGEAIKGDDRIPQGGALLEIDAPGFVDTKMMCAECLGYFTTLAETGVTQPKPEVWAGKSFENPITNPGHSPGY